MILLVTNKRDITTDFIVFELRRRGLAFYRLNSEDLPKASAFHIDRIAAPVLVEAPLIGVDAMWEPYANLRYLQKTVELQLVDTEEHPPTEPRNQAAMSNLTLDWLNFWLEGREDPDPEKAEQYARWEKLCDLQRQQKPKDPNFCVPSRMPASPAALPK